MKKTRLVLTVASLALVIAVTVFCLFVFRSHSLQTSIGGESFPLLTSAPGFYPFNSRSGFTVVQTVFKGDINGEHLVSTITRYIRPDYSDLQLTEYADGSIDLQWHTPDGHLRSWGTGEGAVTDHGPEKVSAPDESDFREFQAKTELFVTYHDLLCSITTGREGYEIVSPEIRGMRLWTHGSDTRLRTLVVKRGAPDELQWKNALARIPANVAGVNR